jgi:PilZ domain
MPAASAPQRIETRIPMRMFVKLSADSSSAFELSATINVSCHGARVETKQYWPAGEQISVRSIRGNLFSRARVAYCYPQSADAYVMGLDFQFPSGDWTRMP